MLTIDATDIQDMQADLKTFKFKAFPYATRATINGAAFKARGFAQENVRNSMIERNRYTSRSIQVDQAKTLYIKRQAATVGSVADYMEDQEFGGTKTTKGKHGVPIATSYSAGLAQDAKPRTRTPRMANTMRKIRLSKRKRKGSSRKQRNLVAIQQAVQSGKKIVYLDLGRTKGIFKVVGGKRKPIIKMLWSMSRKSVVIPKNAWLGPAVERTQQHIPELYRDALRFQLKRHGLFRSR